MCLSVGLFVHMSMVEISVTVIPSARFMGVQDDTGEKCDDYGCVYEFVMCEKERETQQPFTGYRKPTSACLEEATTLWFIAVWYFPCE